MAEEIKSNKSMKFDKIQIKLASPENILEWSHGEVTKPETINYRTLKPEKDGLFCERIFGPSKDWECHCGKYKKIKDKGIVCDKCGVEVTKASVRRDRMGHIHLAAPVSHIWYFKGIPSRMDLILDIGPKNLEKVLYFASYIVIDPGETDIPFKKILSETEYRELCEQYGSKAFRVGMGAEAILELLQMVNLEEEEVRLKEELANTTSQKAARLIKRIEVVEAFKNAGPKILEPIYDVEVFVPSDKLGDVMSDMQGRRGMIMGMTSEKGYEKLSAKVPLKEMSNYSTSLSSLTGGRASFIMKFASYELVPTDVQTKLMKEFEEQEKDEA